MGITISYRGSVADLDRVQDMEDRVLDLALEVGGSAQSWRSACDHDPQRVVRGVIVDLYPGQETTSLLISPEGWLINLTEIEAAEKGELREQPWCFVKTQFGPVEGHVALVELLACLKDEFIPNLELHDEGTYYTSRDVHALRRSFEHVQAAIDGLSEGLQQYGLSSEAAEDPEILMSRIERVAKLVHRRLSRPAESPRADFGDDREFDDAPGGGESQWDELLRDFQRKNERVERAIKAKLASAHNADGVFEAVLRDEGLVDLPGDPSLESEDDKESLPDIFRDDDEDGVSLLDIFCADEDDPFGSGRHSLLQRAMDLMIRLRDLSETLGASPNSHMITLRHGAAEIVGSLAQVQVTRYHCGLEFYDRSFVQLKRSLRWAAFALGSLYSLGAEGVVEEKVFSELQDTVKSLESDILEELRRQRGEDG